MSGSSIYRLLSLRDLRETMAADVAFNEYAFPASQLHGPEPPANRGPEPGESPGHMLGVSNPISRVKDRLQPSGQLGAGPEASGQVQETVQGITIRNEFAGQDTHVQAPGTTIAELDRVPRSGPPLLAVSSVRPTTQRLSSQPEHHRTSGDALTTIRLLGYSTGAARS